MRRFLTYLLAAVLAVSASAVPAAAQVNPFRVLVVPSDQATSVTTEITAVDTAPAILVKYVGVGAATLAIATGAWAFTTDGTTADTTINVQATTPCGASVGTLDTSDADCNTVVELVNEINASANWVAIPVGVLGTDTVTTYVADLTEVASDADGIVTLNDSSATLHTTHAFSVLNSNDIRPYIQGVKPYPNYWNGYHSALEWYIQNFVGSAGAGAIYAVKPTWGGSTGKVYSETVRTLYSFTGAATGVDKELDFKAAPLFVNKGERIVYRGASGSTHTSPVQRARGIIVKAAP